MSLNQNSVLHHPTCYYHMALHMVVLHDRKGKKVGKQCFLKRGNRINRQVNFF